MESEMEGKCRGTPNVSVSFLAERDNSVCRFFWRRTRSPDCPFDLHKIRIGCEIVNGIVPVSVTSRSLLVLHFVSGFECFEALAVYIRETVYETERKADRCLAERREHVR